MFHLPSFSLFFFFNDTATTEIYTLSLHDALPISALGQLGLRSAVAEVPHLERQDLAGLAANLGLGHEAKAHGRSPRSEEHTSELQSRLHLVCRLLLEKKKKIKTKVDNSN